MSKEVVDTRHGKNEVYEIVRDHGIITTEYYVKNRSNGEIVRGTFKNLGDAIRAAEEEARN